MKLSQFKFKLPEEQIAQYPSKFRDECRLLVLNKKTGEIEHKIFKEILQYFDEHDLFVFNDTKVFPARLYGNKEKTGARIEVFLLRELNEELRLWDVLVDPARKIRIGNKLYFGEDNSLVAEVIDNTTSRGRTLRFLFDGDHETFKQVLYSMGETPLPRSIIRPASPEVPEIIKNYKEYIWGENANVNDEEAYKHMRNMDTERYQTIFARNEGAVVAPTSALHFSRELMKRLEIKDINTTFLTLHASLGNFRDIDVEDLTKHKMDSEQLIIPEDACKIINRAQDQKKRICAVGTTVMRALETAVCTEGHVKAYDGWTNKFIFPPYDFTVASSMIANFYFPYSQLLMMVAAFGGYDYVMNAYNEAIKEGYQFGTYGDAMLII